MLYGVLSSIGSEYARNLLREWNIVAMSRKLVWMGILWLMHRKLCKWNRYTRHSEKKKSLCLLATRITWWSNMSGRVWTDQRLCSISKIFPSTVYNKIVHQQANDIIVTKNAYLNQIKIWLFVIQFVSF